MQLPNASQCLPCVDPDHAFQPDSPPDPILTLSLAQGLCTGLRDLSVTSVQGFEQRGLTFFKVSKGLLLLGGESVLLLVYSTVYCCPNSCEHENSMQASSARLVYRSCTACQPVHDRSDPRDCILSMAALLHLQAPITKRESKPSVMRMLRSITAVESGAFVI